MDIFSKRRRSAVMAAIRAHGNQTTELRLIAIFRAHGITGWRRGAVIRGRKTEDPASPRLRRASGGRRAGDWHTPRFAVRPDFVFPG